MRSDPKSEPSFCSGGPRPPKSRRGGLQTALLALVPKLRFGNALVCETRFRRERNGPAQAHFVSRSRVTVTDTNSTSGKMNLRNSIVTFSIGKTSSNRIASASAKVSISRSERA